MGYRIDHLGLGHYAGCRFLPHSRWTGADLSGLEGIDKAEWERPRHLDRGVNGNDHAGGIGEWEWQGREIERVTRNRWKSKAPSLHSYIILPVLAYNGMIYTHAPSITYTHFVFRMSRNQGLRLSRNY
jgi:hypothetical protein